MKPNQPTDHDPALARARELIHERQTALFEERRALRLRQEELLRELHSVEKQINGLEQRIAGMRDLLLHDFPGAEFGRKLPWENLDLPDAAGEVLREAGGYLTPSQIRAGLAEHGVDAGDTSNLQQAMQEALQREAPLMRLNDQLWGRRDWAEEARFTMPHRYREGKHS